MICQIREMFKVEYGGNQETRLWSDNQGGQGTYGRMVELMVPIGVK